MNVSITPELEKFVQMEVASGMYNSASEVVREALRLLQTRRVDRIAQLNREIQLGLDQAARGETIPAEESERRLIEHKKEFFRKRGEG